jgi:hypothetical protein
MDPFQNNGAFPGPGNDYWTDFTSQDSERRWHACYWKNTVGLGAPAVGLCGCGCASCRGGCCPGECNRRVGESAAGDSQCANCPSPDGFPCNCVPGPSSPVEGPTDTYIRCADCRWLQQIGVNPASSKGSAIMQAVQSMPGFAMGLSYGGRPAPGFDGFGVGAAAVDVYSSLSAAQQAWVQQALTAWLADPGTQNWLVATNGASNNAGVLCSGVSSGMVMSNLTAMYAVLGCFQNWYMATSGSQGGAVQLPVGTLDQTTLAALMSTGSQSAWGATLGACPNQCSVPTSGTSTSSNTALYVVGGIAAAAAIGGVGYAVARKRRAR